MRRGYLYFWILVVIYLIGSSVLAVRVFRRLRRVWCEKSRSKGAHQTVTSDFLPGSSRRALFCSGPMPVVIMVEASVSILFHPHGCLLWQESSQHFMVRGSNLAVLTSELPRVTWVRGISRTDVGVDESS